MFCRHSTSLKILTLYFRILEILNFNLCTQQPLKRKWTGQIDKSGKFCVSNMSKKPTYVVHVPRDAFKHDKTTYTKKVFTQAIITKVPWKYILLGQSKIYLCFTLYTSVIEM